MTNASHSLETEQPVREVTLGECLDRLGEDRRWHHRVEVVKAGWEAGTVRTMGIAAGQVVWVLWSNGQVEVIGATGAKARALLEGELQCLRQIAARMPLLVQPLNLSPMRF